MKLSQSNSALAISKVFYLVLLLSITLGVNCSSTSMPTPSRIEANSPPMVTQIPQITVLTRPFSLNLLKATTPENLEPVPTNSDLAQTIVQILGISFRTDSSPGFANTAGIEYDIVTATTGVIIDSEQKLILTDFASVDWQDPLGQKRIDALYIVTNRDPRKPKIEYQAELIAANFARDLAIVKLSKKVDGSEIKSYAPFSEAKIAATVPRDSGQELRVLGHVGTSLDPVKIERLQLVGLMNSNLESINLLLDNDTNTTNKFPEYLKLMNGPNLLNKGAAFTTKGTFAGFLSAMPTEMNGPKVLIRSVDSITDAFAGNNVVSALSESYRREFNYNLSNQSKSSEQIYVSTPTFATLASTNKFGRELAQYDDQFNNVSEIFYEYVVAKTERQIELSEIWLFDDVVIDALSQSRLYSSESASWHGQSLKSVTANTATGLANNSDRTNSLLKGDWELQILIDGSLVAKSKFTIGGEITKVRQISPLVSDNQVSNTGPEITDFIWGIAAKLDGQIIGDVEAGIEKILLGFKYQHFDESMTLGWKVYYGPDLIYSSKEIPWVFEKENRFWIGFYPTEPLWPGWWEFELYLNGEIIKQIGRTVEAN